MRRDNTSEKVRAVLARGDELTISQLADRTGLSTSQIRSSIAKLQVSGEVSSNRGRPAEYRLRDESVSE